MDDPERAERAALILGPASSRRSGPKFRVDVYGGRHRLGPGPELVRRILGRLDEEGIGGALDLVRSEGDEVGEGDRAVSTEPIGLAVAWDRMLAELPTDWSHIYVELVLDSSDFLERAALLLSPVNPAPLGGPLSVRFRCARRVGYGVSPEMARRCLERLDRERITGRLRVVRAVADARPVSTQGPVWHVDGQVV